MRKRIASALLTLVMLLSLVPAMGTTASAAATTGSGTKDDPYIVTTYADLKAKLQSKGTTYIKVTGMDHKVWISPSEGGGYSVSELKVGRDFESRCAAINIPNGAHKYLEIATDLWFMGDAQKNVSGYPPAIFERLIDLNVGASLTITGNRTLRVDFNTMLARNAIIVNWGGNLTIDGDVTLDAHQEMFENIHGTALHLEAGTTNIRGGTFWGDHKYTTASSGGGGVIRIPDTQAAPKLNISGGTFKATNNGMDEGWVYGLDCKNINAKVSLAGGTFESGIRSVENISRLLAEDSKFFKNNAVFDGAVTETKDPLSVRRTATLGDATLNVGGITHPETDKNFNYVMGSGNDKLSVSFNAGPQWFTNYYLKNKIKLNASVSIWKAGVRQNDFTIVQSAGGLSEGRLNFTLDVRNLALEVNNTYTVSLYVDPTLNGERLAEEYLLTQWTFRTAAAPVIKDITTVGLKQNFYLYTTDGGSINYPYIKISGANDGADQPYTITEEGSWASSDGETYTRTVTLKANEGYKFTDATKVTAVNNDGAKPVDNISTTRNSNGTLSVTITTYKRYEVRFLDNEGHSSGNATQYIKKDDTATAPDWKDAPSDKVFVGWKQVLTSTSGEAILPGNQTTQITANTKYYAVLEDPPTYDIKLTKNVPEKTTTFGGTFHIIIENTGTAATGELTASFKTNASNNFKFTNFCYDPDDENAHPSVTPIEEGKKLTIPSLEGRKRILIEVKLPDKSPDEWTPGDYGCAVQVKNNASGERAVSRTVIIKTTVAKQVTVNLYRNDTSKSWPYDVPFVGDVVNLAAVDQNETTGMGPLGAHETFVGWTANKSEIAFEDPTAMTTKFVMPDIDVSSEELAITANFAVASVNGIAITKMPTKTEYEAGEPFDDTGIVVKPTYTDGTMGGALDTAWLSYSPTTGTSLTASNNFVSVSYSISPDTWVAQVPITVTAPTAPTYTVTYDANGGSGTMAPDTATEGVPFTLPLCAFTPPTDKMFDKWDINGTQHASGASVMIATDTSVKAIWKDIPNDGSVTLVNPPTLAVGPFTYAVGTTHTGVVDSGDTDKYTVIGKTASDAGTYTAIASLNNHSHYWTDGTQMPKMFEWTINPADRADKPNAPEMLSRTTDSITLKTITKPGETVEYSMDGSYWQSSTEFTGLSSGTGYTFYARYAAKTNYNPSAASDGATFYTLSGSSSSDSGSTGGAAYAVTILDSKNGSVTADRKTAPAETTVTLTVAPDKGYTLETLTVLAKDGKELKLTEKDGKYTFTMPAGAVEVKATFMDDNTMLNFFVDVKPDDFFYEAVLWAVKNGITNGISATEFGPNLSCTRAQIVTFLWRAAGSPAPKSTAMPFSDVKAGSYYEQAVLWAVENGITGGTGDGKFSPDATCTRAQAVTFLYRASGSPAVSGGSTFSDVAENVYYADAVAWAEKNGVTGGIGGGLFGSDNDCTRGQIVTLLYRAYQGK